MIHCYLLDYSSFTSMTGMFSVHSNVHQIVSHCNKRRATLHKSNANSQLQLHFNVINSIVLLVLKNKNRQETVY